MSGTASGSGATGWVEGRWSASYPQALRVTPKSIQVSGKRSEQASLTVW
ncbi:hypothetical protein STANM309S_05378 [Streptomyces tanashiensis]